MFLGLLQSPVPDDKRGQTQHYVNEIIKLLSTLGDNIKQDVLKTKDMCQTEIKEAYTDLETEETLTNKAFSDTKAADSELAECYAHLQDIASNHSVHCGDKELPRACQRKNDTKMHTFDVARQDTWVCNFTAGSNPTKCTSSTSPLKTDLLAKRDLLRSAYEAWKLDSKMCVDDLTAEKKLCQNTNDSYVGKQATCQDMFSNASDHLCNFRERIDKWTGYLATLKKAQEKGKTMVPPKSAEWTDLNLIICMLEAFRDRQKMTFQEDDYTTCQSKAKDLEWVGELDLMETKMSTLTSSSKYDHECLEFSFSGGLAEKYMAPTQGSGTPVTFFTEPEVSFAYTETGEGCGATSTVSKKVCSQGFRVA